MQIQRAILSVFDKRGLVEFARGLRERGVEILSTGGTARVLGGADVTTTSVSEYTGAPEILGGRVKTLHPRIHGGILAQANAAHQRELAAHDIPMIDLVVVNLYPFERTVSAPDITLSDAIENIDIGGPTMIRAAAKNHGRVAVVVDPDDYTSILQEMARTGGAIGAEMRFRLACKAFSHTAGYDAAIAGYLTSLTSIDSISDCTSNRPELVRAGEATDAAQIRAPDERGQRREFPDTLIGQWHRVRDLRYGENPHQRAAFYRDAHIPLSTTGNRPTIAQAEILQGKPLSYNNILDLDAALACVLDMRGPAAVVVKHTNPCGVAVADEGVTAAYQRARDTDPTSSFGGIVAVNRVVDLTLARLLRETFLECVVAPDFDEQARELLRKKKKLRLLRTGAFENNDAGTGYHVRSIAGGLLVQSADGTISDVDRAKVVTRRAPTDDELITLDFAWRVVKHIKSNAIVYCRNRETLGIGAGQMSRVDAASIAEQKAEKTLIGACAASDAFFPFRDGLDTLASAGARAVIQPGGSIRDQEVIDAANEHDMAMVFTGIRHFRH